MSSIETYLQYIASKVWARDVRTAIVNAIRQCYDDVHNPTLNTEALQAAIQAKIDAGQMAALTIGDRTITAAKLALGVIPTPDTTLSQSGIPADAAVTGTEISNIKADLGDLSELETEANTDLVSAVNEVAQRGLSDALKTALLNCFANVAWINDKGSDYYEELENALYNDLPVVRFVRNRGTSGELIIHTDKRATSELIPFANEVPITIRLRLNTDAFAYFCKFEATDGSILTAVNSADGSAGFFYDKNNNGGIFGWSTVDDEYTFKKRGSLELSTMISGVQGKDLSNNFRLILGDVSLLDDASSEALLPEDPISGLLEVQGRVYKVQEENFPVIEVVKGRGTSGENIIDSAKRALSEPIPYENAVPISIRISLDGSDYMYMIKFTDSNGNIIIGANVRTQNNVQGRIYTSENSAFAGFSTPRDELTFKENGTLTPSILGESSTGQTPGGYFRVAFANAAGIDESLPDTPVTGIIDVQGVKYKLVTRSSE